MAIAYTVVTGIFSSDPGEQFSDEDDPIVYVSPSEAARQPQRLVDRLFGGAR